ncbi:N-acetylglucosamine-specific PTS transporter subunit IIBC [Gordonia neofelifaecis]|uniref:PTS system, N-acetylglucosamine-specific IIBC subunit n=1 Tax=Gordonia neofelifaecis NRRL B-59395 TaxID=644548 RepID=F1YFK7_9ACTN|nr:N-acetylglucosamine-specific PTS transporter subunit IIBC [Gordonia neofelifaecis]EGD56391.1 PTS system, N-acetylglucosamine-specific IIBC subunit [Gordonia neofelifaecis NRRL B-59395]
MTSTTRDKVHSEHPSVRSFTTEWDTPEMMKFLQNLGKSIMLPVAVLPVAAILVGIANWIIGINDDQPNVVTSFLQTAGLAVLSNMALLFAVGVSIGMAKKSDGTSALAGLVSWLVITSLLAPTSVMTLLGRGYTTSIAEQGADISAGQKLVMDNGHLAIQTPDVNEAFAPGAFQNAFIGILCGIIGALCYNRFKDVKLPDALSFFSGRRSVAIVTAGVSLIVALILLFLWPLLYSGLVWFGEHIVDLGAVGTGLYGFFNRLLIPFGLHHALNSVFWFDVAGINDLNNFLSGEGTFGVTGQYMTGFFPIMMFGLPGAALAMYTTAKTTRKKIAYGILLSGAVSSFFVGVTEPLEFAFMFLAPFLFVIHAVFMGLSMAICQLLPVRMGFGFSGGFVDLVLNWKNPMAENPWIIIVLGIGWFFVYFFVFRWVILKFQLKTPGREDDDPVDDDGEGGASTGFIGTASKFIDALGGKTNILELDNCATRLRMEIDDTAKVDEPALKRAGAAGTMKPGGHSVQVIYGLNVQFVKDAMEKIMSGEVDPTTVEAAVEAVDEADAAVHAAEEQAEDQGGDTAVLTKPDTKVVTLQRPIPGYAIALSEVPDKTFASGMMGPGLAIVPTSGEVVAPADATVVTVFPTGHAVGLRLTDGTEVLIHVGLDTVKMKGDGFEPLVKAKDEVTAGQPLINVDLAKIEAAGYPTVTPVVVMNDKTATVEFS